MSVAALVTYGVVKVSGTAPTPQINNYYTTNVVTIGAEVGVKGEDVVVILKAINDKKAVTKDAAGVIQLKP